MKFVESIDRPRVLVVTNYRPDAQNSMLRFGDLLVAQLRNNSEVRIEPIAPWSVFGRLHGLPVPISKHLRNLDKYLLFPLRLWLRSRAATCVHIIDHSNAAYARVVADRPVMVTCHDLFAIRAMLTAQEDAPLSGFGRLLQKANLDSLRAVEHIVCVSRATAQDLDALIPARDRVSVIPNAIAPIYSPRRREAVDAMRASLGLDRTPYLLHVGSNVFYKNRLGVVALFERLAETAAFQQHRLLLVGKAPDSTLAGAIAKSPARARIEVRADVGDEVLAALYSGADWFLFPSRQEGFGWPILEAQACGCPVVTTDRDPMRTVAGNGGAVLIDPDNLNDAAQRIVAAVDRRETFITAGLRNAAAYRPDHIITQYFDVYRSLSSRSQLVRT